MYTVNIAMHDDYYRIIIILGILGVTQAGGGNPMMPPLYSIHQKECNKRVAVALISTAYHAPRLSLCARRTFTLSLKVCRLVKCHNAWIAVLFQELRHFSCENTAHLAKSAAIRFPHKSRGKP